MISHANGTGQFYFPALHLQICWLHLEQLHIEPWHSLESTCASLLVCFVFQSWTLSWSQSPFYQLPVGDLLLRQDILLVCKRQVQSCEEIRKSQETTLWCIARKDTKLPSNELNGCTGHWIFRSSRNWKMACDAISAIFMKPTQTLPMTAWEHAKTDGARRCQNGQAILCKLHRVHPLNLIPLVKVLSSLVSVLRKQFDNLNFWTQR